jgi:hypothetical protein
LREDLGTCGGINPCTLCPEGTAPNNKKSTCKCFVHATINDEKTHCDCDDGYTLSDDGAACVKILGTYGGINPCTLCPEGTAPNTKKSIFECIIPYIMNNEETHSDCGIGYTLNDNGDACVKILGTCGGINICTLCPEGTAPNTKKSTCECVAHSLINQEETHCDCEDGYTLTNNACSVPSSNCPVNSTLSNGVCVFYIGFVFNSDNTVCSCKSGYNYNSTLKLCSNSTSNSSPALTGLISILLILLIC